MPDDTEQDLADQVIRNTIVPEDYPFTPEEMQQASINWGANCGPGSLAFAAGLHIKKIKGIIPRFRERFYTSPTMMRSALKNLNLDFFQIPLDEFNMAIHHPELKGELFNERVALVRIQWGGPWMDGKNPFKDRHSHWVAMWNSPRHCGADLVFDINAGIYPVRMWETKIIPQIVNGTPGIVGATGEWYPTHIWRLQRVIG